MIAHETFEVATGGPIAVHDVTPEVRRCLRAHPVRAGQALVFTRHTTTALVVNEHESGLLRDLAAHLQRLAPAGEYAHDDLVARGAPPGEPRNAPSHLMAMMLASAVVVPVVDGGLGLGRWQSVLLVEVDGPRTRTVSVQISGE